MIIDHMGSCKNRVPPNLEVYHQFLHQESRSTSFLDRPSTHGLPKRNAAIIEENQNVCTGLSEHGYQIYHHVLEGGSHVEMVIFDIFTLISTKMVIRHVHGKW